MPTFIFPASSERISSHATAKYLSLPHKNRTSQGWAFLQWLFYLSLLGLQPTWGQPGPDRLDYQIRNEQYFVDPGDEGGFGVGDSSCPTITITQPPASQTACSGKGLQYTVTTAGSTDQATYDWEYNDNDGKGWLSLSIAANSYPGYNTATLTTNGNEGNGRQYRVKISDSCGTVYSEAATLTLLPGPTISGQPASQTACSGKGLQYTVKADGTDLTYDWEYNDGGGWASLSANANLYPGYNTATLTTNGNEGNGRQYRAKITSGSCTVYSQPAAFTRVPSPTISVQPLSQTACNAVINGLQYSVQADGTDLRYDWEYNDNDGKGWASLSYFPENYPGYNTATLTTDGEEKDGRQYRVKVDNGYCPIFSDPATFTKLATPLITQQPADQIACSSKGLQYRVQVKQEASLSYDWEVNDGSGWASLSAQASAYPGYNTGILTINGEEPNGRQYRVKVDNGYCPIYSDPVTFTKLASVVITQQPASQSACSGTGLQYSVQADGTDLSYDWEYNDNDGKGWLSLSVAANSYPGYYTATLTTNGRETPGRQYRVKIINECGSVYSQPATFTLLPGPTISAQPASQSACSGKGLQYSVQADGGYLSYDWEFNDNDGKGWVSLSGFADLYPGYNTATLTTNSTEKNGRQYRVKIMNSCGVAVYSQSVTFTFAKASPVITGQPSSQTACLGKGLQYEVLVEGTGLTYDWEFNDNDGKEWVSLSGYVNLYPGYNTATLTTNGTEKDGRQYRAKVSNDCGSLYSNPATFHFSGVTITAQPASQSACSAKGLQYSVSATGTDLRYDWEFNDNDGKGWLSLSGFADLYPGYNTATLTTNGTEKDGRQYRAKVSNDCGSVYTDPATFHFSGATITSQPVSQSACSAKGLQYSVTVRNGLPSPLGYLWEYNDGEGWHTLTLNADLYPGYNTATLTTNGTEKDGRQYRVFILSGCDMMLYSEPATFHFSGVTITAQPASQTACLAKGLQYSVSATGTDLRYDWEFNDNDGKGWLSLSGMADQYPGYNTATLTTNGTEKDGRQYRAKVSNDCGSVYTDPATFRLIETTITSQPTSQTSCQSNQNGLQYSVSATGTDLAYDWEFNDNDGKGWVSLSGMADQYPGYNTVTLTTNGTEKDGRQYRAKITSGSCTVYSQPAAFTQGLPPTISAQPLSQTACSGKGLQYSVTASGANLLYEWEFNNGSGWVSLSGMADQYPGYNTPTLTTNGTEQDGRQYRVQVFNDCDSVYSNPATFSLQKITITAQPASQTACTARFNNLQYSVQAVGTDLRYDWEYSDNDGMGWVSLTLYPENYPGYNTATLTTNGVEKDGRQYRVKISDSCGTVYSEAATFRLQPPLSITTQPPSASSVLAGTQVNVSVTLSGTASAYQWYKDNTLLAAQTSPTLALASVQPDQSGSYWLVATGPCNSLTSTSFSLSVVDSGFTITGLSANRDRVPAGQSVEFTATLTGLVDADIYSYTLTNGQEDTPLTGDYHGPDYRESVTAGGSGPQTYTLTVTTQKGRAIATVSIFVTQAGISMERFAIGGVTAVDCETISDNQRQVRFTPQYVGTNGEPIRFSVVNELAPTTQPGPYSLRLYTDNPTITLVASQGGQGEVRFVYNWLAACASGGIQAQPPTTSGISSQTLGVGQPYQLRLTDYVSDPDGQTPRFSAQGLPQGLSLLESVISGTPSVTGTYPVSVTATDPGGLSIVVTFQLTIMPALNTSPDFSIGGVSPVSCVLVDSVKQGYQVRFIPQYGGLTGQPIRFWVVNELAPTTSAGPYTLPLYADNPVIILKATQSGSPQEASFSYNWLAACRTQSPVTPGSFALVGVTPVSCEVVSGGQRRVRFTPQYAGLDGSPIRFAVVNELSATADPGPYSLNLYTDNPQITLVARQGDQMSTYRYEWLGGCTAAARLGTGELGGGLQVRVLGNPVVGGEVVIEVTGAEGLPLQYEMTDSRGQEAGSHQVSQAGRVERQSLRITNQPAGLLLLRVSTPTQSQSIKLIKAN